MLELCVSGVPPPALGTPGYEANIAYDTSTGTVLADVCGIARRPATIAVRVFFTVMATDPHRK